MRYVNIILIAILLLSSFVALAQKAGEEIKFGTFPNKTYKKTNAVFLPPVYKDETKLKSTQEEPNHSIEYVGNSTFTDFDFFKKATISSATDDETTYILYFTSPNAVALTIGFSEFILPENSEVFFENEARDTTYVHYTGAFSGNIGKIFDSNTIMAGSVFMRLKIKNNNFNDCKLRIKRIGQTFKAWWKHLSLKSSSSTCQFDVACYPDYSNWINEINSVVWI